MQKLHARKTRANLDSELMNITIYRHFRPWSSRVEPLRFIFCAQKNS